MDIKESMQRMFNDYFARYGQLVTINSIKDIKSCFKEIDDKEYNDDTKYIITPVETINQGSIVNALGCQWLCVEKPVNYYKKYDKAIIAKCNNILKFKYNGLEIITPCILEEENSMTLETNENTQSPNSYYLVTISYNDTNKKLPLGGRFIFGLSVYKLIGTNDITTPGILKLKIQLDAERIGLDDFTTGYADNSNLKSHNYSLNVVNGNTISSKVGDNPIQLNIELFDNKVKQASQSTDFIYQSDNEKICTIDNNGNVSFIGVGVCNITVKYKKDETVVSNVNITVEHAIIPAIDKYSIKIISGSSSMILGSSNSKYTCAVYNNGIEDTNKTITWSLDNIALATIFSNPSNRSCVLKVNKTTKGTVKLKCMLSNDNTIFDEKSITIQTVF